VWLQRCLLRTNLQRLSIGEQLRLRVLVG